jgi:hypothetical protein
MVAFHKKSVFSPMIVGERTLRHKIPENLKSGCLGAQRGDRGWSFPQVHTCAVRDGYAATFRQ